MAAEAPERAFPVFPRGKNRDDILLNFRVLLRRRTDPQTGQLFTEREIATATGPGSRWWMEADAVDLVEMSTQQRALYLADQVRIDRAAGPFLKNHHGKQWGEAPLPASGGSGPVDAEANAGTIFVGSTVIPDSGAAQAQDPAGKTYQVLFTTVTANSGVAALQLKAIDTGIVTNLAPGTKLLWSQNKPVGAAEFGTTTALFTGGTPAESSQQFARRLSDQVRHKAAAGNNAHFRKWARASNSAVDDAFVYACAMHAGTTVVCITQKRSNVQGPAGRVASIGTLTDTTAFLTPPASPVVPTPPFVLLVTFVSVPSDLVLGLSMPTSQDAGWKDKAPWPGLGAGGGEGDPCTITAVTDQSNFQITRAAGSPDLPTGVTAPSLMLFDSATARYESLVVQSVTAAGGDDFDVVLAAPATLTLATTIVVCPDTERRALIADTVESYFDSLGPGELVDLATDTRAHRAKRFPRPNEAAPQRAGSSVTNYLHDALGTSLPDSTLQSASVQTPPLPTDIVAGPNQIVSGTIGIYPLV